VKETIDIDTLSKVDLRVAKVISAELVEGADKLLRLSIDLGTGQPRQIFAGIRKAYAPESLVGRSIVVVANLAPRKMRFGLSEGMALAAASRDGDLFVISPDSGASPGDTVA
jgi:methionyl-tRNA synthetase